MDYRYDIIEWRRLKLGLSYDELATEAEVSGDTALRGCKGANITTRTLRQLSKALGLDGDRLLDRKLKRTQFHTLILPRVKGKTPARGNNGATPTRRSKRAIAEQPRA